MFQLTVAVCVFCVQVAIRLLDSDFPDECVRNFAVRALEGLPDEQLEDFLIQLVQVYIYDRVLPLFIVWSVVNKQAIASDTSIIFECVSCRLSSLRLTTTVLLQGFFSSEHSPTK